VKFQDGNEFDAKAVAFNVDRLKSGKISSRYSGMWKNFLKNDPEELIDISLKGDFQNHLNKLKTTLADSLYDDDLAFLN
jgi:ABC-type transport system substrate-binding protein